MALKLELAKTLVILMFNEIDGMYKAGLEDNALAAKVCCSRWNIFESLANHVFNDITAVADQLNSMANYKEVG